MEVLRGLYGRDRNRNLKTRGQGRGNESDEKNSKRNWMRGLCGTSVLVMFWWRDRSGHDENKGPYGAILRSISSYL